MYTKCLFSKASIFPFTTQITQQAKSPQTNSKQPQESTTLNLILTNLANQLKKKRHGNIQQTQDLV